MPVIFASGLFTSRLEKLLNYKKICYNGTGKFLPVPNFLYKTVRDTKKLVGISKLLVKENLS